MATVAEQLTSLANTKTAIKDAIVAKGVAVADDTPFSGYAGKIGQISGGGGSAPATKLGVSIDNLLGDVVTNAHTDSELQIPRKDFVFNGAGIKNISNGALMYKFFRYIVTSGEGITELLLPDLENVVANACTGVASNNASLLKVDLGKLTAISAVHAFDSSFSGCTKLADVKGLENITEITALNACLSMFKDCTTLPKTGLDNLSVISGDHACERMFYNTAVTDMGLNNLTSITSQYGAAQMFGNCKGLIKVYFPNLTTLGHNYALGKRSSDAIFYSCTNITEIHFRADMQTQVEAQSAYSYKFGAENATIYFDL